MVLLSKNPISVWDFTLTCQGTDQKELIKQFHEASGILKKWTFQEELSETGYAHYQGRVSFGTKTRSPITRCSSIPALMGARWSVTSNENRTNDFYVTKAESRAAGPWSNRDEPPPYIPRQFREVTSLYPWQQSIWDDVVKWDSRTINFLYDVSGNIGKSVLVGKLRGAGRAAALPPANDFADLLGMVCDRQRRTTPAKAFIVDMPRAIHQERLGGLYAGLESVKNGYAYDKRYKFREAFFDSPIIWVFGNVLPDPRYLSYDRWKFWCVNGKRELVKFVLPSAAPGFVLVL